MTWVSSSALSSLLGNLGQQHRHCEYLSSARLPFARRGAGGTFKAEVLAWNRHHGWTWGVSRSPRWTWGSRLKEGSDPRKGQRVSSSHLLSHLLLFQLMLQPEAEASPLSLLEHQGRGGPRPHALPAALLPLP